MLNDIEFRLGEVLMTRYKKRKSWEALSLSIAKSNRDQKTIDRRKLRRLCEGEDVSLAISELKALDRFLRNYNEGLAENPIFSRNENIFDSFRESHALTCFIAAKFTEMLRTELVSRWDMRGLILLNNMKPGDLTMDIQDIPLGDRIDQTETDEWVGKLNHPSSMIAIGSPLACPASEYLMARMVDRDPYRKTSLTLHTRLPFYFIFQDIEESFCPSTFFISKEEAKELLPDKKALIDSICDEKRGIIVGNDLYVGDRFGESYALLIAQRHPPEGHPVLTLCGSYGPSTYGLAKILIHGGITRKLPKLSPEVQFQPIMISVVETIITPRIEQIGNPKKEHFENRKLEKEKVVRPPALFHYHNGEWEEENKTNS